MRQTDSLAARALTHTARLGRAACFAVAAPALAMTFAVQPASAGGMYELVSHDFRIGIDQARMLRIEGDAAIVAVGNPSIADAIIQGPDSLLLVGRSYGATNILVYDHDGNETASLIVNVVDAAPRLVTLHRGNARSSYNCAPDCQSILRIGDASGYTDRISQQTDRKIGLATKGAEATAEGSGNE